MMAARSSTASLRYSCRPLHALVLLLLLVTASSSAAERVSAPEEAEQQVLYEDAYIGKGTGALVNTTANSDDSLPTDASEKSNVYLQPITRKSNKHTTDSTLQNETLAKSDSSTVFEDRSLNVNGTDASKALKLNETLYRHNDNIQVESSSEIQLKSRLPKAIRQTTPSKQIRSTLAHGNVRRTATPFLKNSRGPARFDNVSTNKSQMRKIPTSTVKITPISQNTSVSSNSEKVNDFPDLFRDKAKINNNNIIRNDYQITFSDLLGNVSKINTSSAIVTQVHPTFKSIIHSPANNEDLAIYGKDLSIEKAILEKEVYNVDVEQDKFKSTSSFISNSKTVFKLKDITGLPKKHMKMVKHVGGSRWIAEEEQGFILPAADGSEDAFVPEILLQDTEFLLAMAKETRGQFSKLPPDPFQLSSSSSSTTRGLVRPGRHATLMGGMPYSFGFIVDDEYTENFQTRQEEGGADGVVTGCYQVLESTGLVRTVLYRADHHGFQVLSTSKSPDKTPCAGLETASEFTGLSSQSAHSTSSNKAASSSLSSFNTQGNLNTKGNFNTEGNFNSQSNSNNYKITTSERERSSLVHSKASNILATQQATSDYKSNDFSGAQQATSDFKSHDFSGAQHATSDFKSSDFSGAQHKTSEFKSSDFSGTQQASSDFKSSNFIDSQQATSDHSTSSASSNFKEEHISSQHQESMTEYLQSLTRDLHSSFSDKSSLASDVSLDNFVNFPFVLIPVTTFVDLREKGHIDGSVQSFGAFVQPVSGKKSSVNLKINDDYHSKGQKSDKTTLGNLHAPHQQQQQIFHTHNQHNVATASKHQHSSNQQHQLQQQQTVGHLRQSGREYEGGVPLLPSSENVFGNKLNSGNGYLGHKARPIQAGLTQFQSGYNLQSEKSTRKSESSSISSKQSVSNTGLFGLHDANIQNNFNTFNTYNNKNNANFGGSFKRHQSSSNQKTSSNKQSKNEIHASLNKFGTQGFGQTSLGSSISQHKSDKSKAGSSRNSGSSLKGLSAFVRTDVGPGNLYNADPLIQNIGFTSTYKPQEHPTFPVYETEQEFTDFPIEVPKANGGLHGNSPPNPSLQLKNNAKPLSALPVTTPKYNGYGSLAAEFVSLSKSSQTSQSSSSSASSSSLKLQGGIHGRSVPNIRLTASNSGFSGNKRANEKNNKFTRAPIPAYLASLSDPELSLRKSTSAKNFSSSTGYSPSSVVPLYRESRNLKPRAPLSSIQDIPIDKSKFKPPTKLESMVDSPVIRSSDWTPMIAINEASTKQTDEPGSELVAIFEIPTSKLSLTNQLLASESNIFPVVALPLEVPTTENIIQKSHFSTLKSEPFLSSFSHDQNQNVIRQPREFSSSHFHDPTNDVIGIFFDSSKNVGFGHFHTRGHNNFNSHFYSQKP